MSARRFFVEGVRVPGESITLAGSDAHKVVHVLRLRAGDALEVADSAGALFSVRIDDVRDGSVRATVVEPIAAVSPAADAALRIDVAQAVPKGQKMDFVVEKTTELGAAAILPFYCERTVVHDVGGAKLERWRRLAKTAAQQSGRRDVPPVHDALGFHALLARFHDYDAVLFPWELAPRTPLRETLPPLLRGARRAMIAIGPEGGFAHHEAEAAVAHGAHLLWLGSRILRTETAALALLAVIDALAAS